ncbi:MAG: hypothetical protein J0H86_01315 [Xanthomonadaceae bacterium]|nr:hypothetical protein [Xanthomonadaceae bacterium]
MIEVCRLRLSPAQQRQRFGKVVQAHEIAMVACEPVEHGPDVRIEFRQGPAFDFPAVERERRRKTTMGTAMQCGRRRP